MIKMNAPKSVNEYLSMPEKERVSFISEFLIHRSMRKIPLKEQQAIFLNVLSDAAIPLCTRVGAYVSYGYKSCELVDIGACEKTLTLINEFVSIISSLESSKMFRQDKTHLLYSVKIMIVNVCLTLGNYDVINDFTKNDVSYFSIGNVGKKSFEKSFYLTFQNVIKVLVSSVLFSSKFRNDKLNDELKHTLKNVLSIGLSKLSQNASLKKIIEINKEISFLCAFLRYFEEPNNSGDFGVDFFSLVFNHISRLEVADGIQNQKRLFNKEFMTDV